MNSDWSDPTKFEFWFAALLGAYVMFGGLLLVAVAGGGWFWR